MPDKKYKELSKRLETKNKQRSGGNFRSYGKSQQDLRADSQRQKDRYEPASSRENKSNGPRKANQRFLRNLMIMAVPFIVAILLVIFGVYALTNKNATEISVNGEAIGQTKSTKLTKEEFLASLNAVIEQVEETKIMITDNIELTPVHGKKKLLMDDSQLLNLLADVVSYKVLAAEISVNGQKIGIVKNQNEAKKIFDSIQAPYMTEGADITASFVQDVKATDNYFSLDEIVPSDTIRAELSKPVTSQIEYSIVEGDTLSKIAAENGITVNDIKDQNPELDVTKPLQIGQRLNLESTAPFVSVITIENSVETEEIKMPIEERSDPSLPTGKKGIIQQGKPGKKEITTKITRINGNITSKGEPTENILEPAVTQIYSVGP